MIDVTGLEPHTMADEAIWPLDTQVIVEWPTSTLPYGPTGVKLIDHEGNVIPGVLSMVLRMDGTHPYPEVCVVHLVDEEGNPTQHAIPGYGGRPRTAVALYRVVGYRSAS